MPQNFDSAWEYYEPDPEIAEALGDGPYRSQRVRSVYDVLDVPGEVGDRNAGFGGSKVGFSNYRVQARAATVRSCRKCGREFRPTDPNLSWAYCSRACTPPRSFADRIEPALRLFRRGYSSLYVASRLGASESWCSRLRNRLLPELRARKGAYEAGPTMLSSYRPDVLDPVRVKVPENQRLHGTVGVVTVLEEWGAHLDLPSAATHEFRALWEEMVPLGEDVGPALSAADVALAESELRHHCALRNGRIETQADIETPADLKYRSVNALRSQARQKGYTGDPCERCGGMNVRRNGACTICEDCKESSGCS